MARYNNEDMPVNCSIGGFAVDINDGKKVIMYINTDTTNRILEQLKTNNGQLSQTTAMALGMTVATAIKDLEDYKFKQMRAVNHKPSDLNYDVEESDDPRTVFNWDGDGDE